MKRIILPLFLLIILMHSGFSQTAELDGSTYIQDFNTLGNGGGDYTALPAGWYFLETGTGADGIYKRSNGSNNLANTYSFGTGTEVERSLGSLRNLFNDFSPSWGVQFENTSGETIISLDVEYTGEHWRMGQAGPVDQLKFEYSVDATSIDDAGATWIEVTNLNFYSIVNTGGSPSRALNGNDVANSELLSATISGLMVAPDDVIWFRWTDVDLTAGTLEDGLAVDDLSVTPNTIGSNTEVNFGVETEAIVSEDAGAYEIIVTLFNPSADDPTTVDLVLVGGTGTADDINNYTTQTITIPAGQIYGSQIITITDDSDIEGDEVLMFELQNAAGGTSASIASPFEFTLTIADDDVPPLYYRSTGDGAWSNVGSWETSLDGGDPWVAATTAPDYTRGPITILSGHTITLNTYLEVDELTIDNGGTLLRGSNSFYLRNGDGTDLTINGLLRHNGGSAPDFSSESATVAVGSTGEIRITNNLTDQSVYGTSPQVSWTNNSLFHWNVNSPFSMGTYFPGTAAGLRPRFRTIGITSTVGNATNLVRINGLFEINQNNTIQFVGTGTKEFRNGIRGNGIIDQVAGSGQFLITGTNALLAGTVGEINLNGDDGLLISATGDVTYSGDKPFNGGTLTVDGILRFGSGSRTMTIADSGPGSIGLQGSGSIYLNTAGSTHTIQIASESPTFVPNLLIGTAASTIEFYSDNLQNIPALNYANLLSTGAGERVLPATGNVGITGIFTPGTNTYTTTGSTLVYNGTTQSITAFDYFNLTIANSGTKTLNGNSSVSSYLNLEASTTLDTSTDSLTLISTATETASIGIVPASASIVGNITTQRYMSGFAEIYRYIGSPINQPAISQIQDDVQITGSFAGADAVPGWNNDPSFFIYDESVPGGFEVGYVGQPVSSNTETMQNGVGYALFVRDATPTVIDFTGVPNIGSFNLPVTYNDNGVETADGWNLVANPYASAISWDNAGWTKDNIDDAVYIKDNSGGGGYASYVNGVGVNGGSEFIASGQAFWVLALDGTANLAVSETVKATENSTSFFRMGAPDNILRLTLENNGRSDEIAIHIDDNATSQFDKGMDALKFGGEDGLPHVKKLFELASISDEGHRLAINSFAQNDCSIKIPLAIDNALPGDYSLNLAGLETITKNMRIVLVDNFKEERINLDDAGMYAFSISEAAKSNAPGRFVLELNAEELNPTIAFVEGKLETNYDSNVTWYYNGTAIEGANGSSIVPKLSGTYTVEVSNGTCLSTIDYDHQISDADFGYFFSAAPNPVENRLTLRVYSNEFEILALNMFDIRGKKYNVNKIETGSGEYQIDMTNLPSGVYLLKLVAGDRIFTQRIIKK